MSSKPEKTCQRCHFLVHPLHEIQQILEGEPPGIEAEALLAHVLALLLQEQLPQHPDLQQRELQLLVVQLYDYVKQPQGKCSRPSVPQITTATSAMGANKVCLKGNSPL